MRLSGPQIQWGESQCTSGSICSLIVLWNFSLSHSLLLFLLLFFFSALVNILSLPYLSPTLISLLPLTLSPKPHSHWLTVCEDKRRASCPFCHSWGLLQCHQVPTGTCWEASPLPGIHLPACPQGPLALSVPGSVIRTAALEGGLAPASRTPQMLTTSNLVIPLLEVFPKEMIIATSQTSAFNKCIYVNGKNLEMRAWLSKWW